MSGTTRGSTASNLAGRLLVLAPPTPPPHCRRCEGGTRGTPPAAPPPTIPFFTPPAPATPFAAFAIAPLAPSETSVRFAAAWTAPATPGTYDVVADVDFGDDLAEGDEANNRFTWTIDVLAGPLTTLVV